MINFISLKSNICANSVRVFHKVSQLFEFRGNCRVIWQKETRHFFESLRIFLRLFTRTQARWLSSTRSTPSSFEKCKQNRPLYHETILKLIRTFNARRRFVGIYRSVKFSRMNGRVAATIWKFPAESEKRRNGGKWLAAGGSETRKNKVGMLVLKARKVRRPLHPTKRNSTAMIYGSFESDEIRDDPWYWLAQKVT